MAADSPDTPMLTLVLGGARSGKSRHAEGLLAALPEPWSPPWLYIATAQPFDEEMRARIAGHRARRGPEWDTVEAPLDLPAALLRARHRPVLVDCLTLWLSNLILGERDLEAAAVALETALAQRSAPAVLVSNEVGLGIVPENALARRFRDAAGILHQRLAERAGRVVFTVAGIPMVVK
ncbi:bifunctional adenosylcobinamide kinase/adenosylcobinamide-phosphate guanylyltransferase [Roseomonas gilardii subsp. gilardii]|uniref:bifunctional adenosylcobinamide kinase/adenosylcobinamide-phosphate guanylyltransferase n=1 Tax=Roseomonas gilardii TaxID=257708 RepID=UPI001FFAEBF4|nr:bifunctional adenosylcobinamide kinase/adenosylcobinamide-phosphate guanylyltransferase [Roseomonas gilardii]UPG71226.1 bifunctional adenosylcobinamide kinase/adenosylcobinamide-phosphate guanylyltransferase [Roseomonas gilardii subsp. gilardii]